MKNLVGKTVNLQLVGVNGNAFAIIGAFRRQAKNENWTDAEIELVQTEAISGDYERLLAVFATHCEPFVNDEDRIFYT